MKKVFGEVCFVVDINIDRGNDFFVVVIFGEGIYNNMYSVDNDFVIVIMIFSKD